MASAKHNLARSKANRKLLRIPQVNLGKLGPVASVSYAWRMLFSSSNSLWQAVAHLDDQMILRSAHRLPVPKCPHKNATVTQPRQLAFDTGFPNRTTSVNTKVQPADHAAVRKSGTTGASFMHDLSDTCTHSAHSALRSLSTSTYRGLSTTQALPTSNDQAVTCT